MTPHACNIRAGIAVSPATDIAFLPLIIDYIDLICVMTVDPGFAGQAIIPTAIEKMKMIKEIAKMADHEIGIMVDGQVNQVTAKAMTQAGANVLVLGSSGLFRYKKSEYVNIMTFYRAL